MKKYFHTAVPLFKPARILTLSSVCGSRTIITTTDHWVMIQRTRCLIIVHHRPSNFIDNRTVQSGGSLWIIDLGVRCHSFVNSRSDLEREREREMIKDDRTIRFRRIYCLFWGKLVISKSWKSSIPSFACPQRLDPFPPIVFHFQDGTLKNSLNDASLFFFFFSFFRFSINIYFLSFLSNVYYVKT